MTDEATIVSTLFNEFKFRHEHCWRLIFRASSAVLLIYTIPFIKIDTERDISPLILGFPLTGIILSLGGTLMLLLEYKLLSFVETKYNECKDKIKPGTSNLGIYNHMYIGYSIIFAWGVSLITLGVIEFFFLSATV